MKLLLFQLKIKPLQILQSYCTGLVWPPFVVTLSVTSSSHFPLSRFIALAVACLHISPNRHTGCDNAVTILARMARPCPTTTIVVGVIANSLQTKRLRILRDSPHRTCGFQDLMKQIETGGTNIWPKLSTRSTLMD